MPPLRGAVLWCIGLRRGPVPAETLAVVAGVSEQRAFCYGRILVRERVLRQVEAGFIPGPEWPAWRESPVRTRPNTRHDTGRRVLAAREDATRVLLDMRRAIAKQIHERRELRHWSANELAVRAGCHPRFVYLAEGRCRPPPVCILALIARALDTTVDELLASPA